MAKAGIPLASLRTLVLSHLHFDHIGGLFAIFSERYQMLAPGVLTIYGPPGTKATVDALIASVTPFPGATPPFPTISARRQAASDLSVRVVEVTDGSKFTIGAAAIFAASNSYYSATPRGSDYISLSYQFEMPDRSIVFTGDTGPSPNVERLARDADLLVSEIMDPEVALAQLKASRPDMPEAALAGVREHFEKEHLSPYQAGLLAQRADVKALVLTYDAVDPEHAGEMRPKIAANHKGPVTFARDLDVF